MDDRLEQALEFANYKTTVFQQKQNLKLKLESALTYAINGGTFKIDQQLISFVSVLINHGADEAVLIDARENPVKIQNLDEFLGTCISLYFEATNSYLANTELLRKARSVKLATKL